MAPSGSSAGSRIDFQLPSRLFGNDKVVLRCIDCHAGGEPARVVLSGVPPLPQHCATALQKRAHMMEHCDHFRKLLLLEPRGYPCQNANYIFLEDDGTIQYVIAEQNKIYPMMSGHNTICVATALLECGVVVDNSFTLHAPAGPIAITARRDTDNNNNNKVTSIAFRNAPAFVEHLNVVVEVPHGIGLVTVDIAYGGMWYAIVTVEQFTNASPGVQNLDPACGKELCRLGEMIKVACREQYPVQHPTENYPGVDILAFRKPGKDRCSAKNAVIMSNNELDWEKPETWTAMIDRSPCGTGTCAIMAVMHARGELHVGEPFVHESIVGSKFIGTILEETTLAGRTAIVPQVEGSACISQYSEVVVDPEDPFQEGYRVGDIW